MSRRLVKVVVVGDSRVGKTTLLNAYTSRKAQTADAEPIPFSNYLAETAVDGTTVDLTLWDTNGGAAYEQLRPLAYPGTSVVLVCFAVNNRQSLQHCTEWQAETRVQLPPETVPRILVALKSDVDGGGEEGALVSAAEVAAMATEIGAAASLECSSVTLEGVEAVVHTAIRLVVGGRSGGCELM